MKDLTQLLLNINFNSTYGDIPSNINNIVFCSTGSIYGEPKKFPTPEQAEFPLQTSFYGASKLAGESLIQVYCESFGF